MSPATAFTTGPLVLLPPGLKGDTYVDMGCNLVGYRGRDSSELSLRHSHKLLPCSWSSKREAHHALAFLKLLGAGSRLLDDTQSWL